MIKHQGTFKIRKTSLDDAVGREKRGEGEAGWQGSQKNLRDVLFLPNNFVIKHHEFRESLFFEGGRRESMGQERGWGRGECVIRKSYGSYDVLIFT